VARFDLKISKTPLPTLDDLSYRHESGKRVHLGRSEIPHWIAVEAFAQYARMNDQTFEALHRRGGFNRDELLDLIAGGKGDGSTLEGIRLSRGMAHDDFPRQWQKAYGLIVKGR
jgi:hypothetical protein